MKTQGARTRPSSARPLKYGALCLFPIMLTIYACLSAQESFSAIRTLQDLTVYPNITDQTAILLHSSEYLARTLQYSTEELDSDHDSDHDPASEPEDSQAGLKNYSAGKGQGTPAVQINRTEHGAHPVASSAHSPELFIASSLLPLSNEGILSRVALATFSWLQLQPAPYVYYAVEQAQDLTLLKRTLKSRYSVPPDKINRVRTLPSVKFEQFNATDKFKSAKLPRISDLIHNLIAVGTDVSRVGGTPNARFLWVNSDIALYQDLMPMIDMVSQKGKRKDFCLFGRRHEMQPTVQVRHPADLRKLQEETEKLGKSAGSWYIDWISFGRSTWGFVPNFVVARNKFDNWLIANGRGLTVDGSSVITATHQSHDYRHAISSKEAAKSSSQGGGAVIVMDNPGKRHNDMIASKLEQGSKKFKSWSLGSTSQACWGLHYTKKDGEKVLCSHKRDGCTKKSVPRSWPKSCPPRKVKEDE